MIATILWNRVPIFVLSVVEGPVLVGIFSVAQQVAEKAVLPAQAVQEAIYRKMSGCTREQATELMNAVLRFLPVAMGRGVILAGGAAVPLLIRILFGQPYAGASSML